MKDLNWTVEAAMERHVQAMIRMQQDMPESLYSKKELSLYMCCKWFDYLDPNLLLDVVEVRHCASTILERGNILLLEFTEEYFYTCCLYNTMTDVCKRLRSRYLTDFTNHEFEYLQEMEFKCSALKNQMNYITELCREYAETSSRVTSLIQYASQK